MGTMAILWESYGFARGDARGGRHAARPRRRSRERAHRQARDEPLGSQSRTNLDKEEGGGTRMRDEPAATGKDGGINPPLQVL